MDLIGSLVSTLGVAPDQAKAVAGVVLGGVQQKLGAESPEAAGKLSAAVPELGGWQAAAAKLMGGAAATAPEPASGLGALGGLLGGFGAPAAPAASPGFGSLLGAAAGAAGASGGLGGLLGAAATALGGEEARQTAAVVGVLSKLNIDASKAAMVAPAVLSFLKSRLDASTLNTVLQFAPMLAGLVGGGAAMAPAPAAAAPAAAPAEEESGLGGLLSGFLKR